MIGCNQIVICEAEMRAAVQYYLEQRVLRPGVQQQVSKITYRDHEFTVQMKEVDEVEDKDDA